MCNVQHSVAQISTIVTASVIASFSSVLSLSAMEDSHS